MRASMLVELNRLFETDDPAVLKDALRDAVAALQSASLRIARVNEITLAVSRSMSVQAILDVLWQQLKWVVPFDHIVVCRRSEGRWYLHPRGSRASDPGPPLRRGLPLALALEAGRPGVYHDAELEGCPGQQGSLMVVPLSSEQEIIGALAFGSAEAGAYSADDVRVASMLALQLAAVFRNASRFRRLRVLASDLEEANARHRNALLNVMPLSVVEELIAHNSVQPVVHEAATVVFTDLVGFTRAAARMSPREIIDSLDTLFAGFDLIVQRHGLEKLKTIGDAYMFCGGLPHAQPDHALRAVEASREIVRYVESMREQPGTRAWQVRVGIHSGPVVAGVIGRDRQAYDVWGDTVNIAARLESSSEPGRINVSAETHALIAEHFHCEARGEVAVKGRGALPMFFVEQPTAPPARAALPSAPPIAVFPRRVRPVSRVPGRRRPAITRPIAIR